MEAIHKLADREIKAGRMLDNGGLMPVAMGAQVRVTGGKLTVLDGPFVEAKEVIGGYAVFELQGKEEAVASAVEFMRLSWRRWPISVCVGQRSSRADSFERGSQARCVRRRICAPFLAGAAAS
jgi:YCII-related domain